MDYFSKIARTIKYRFSGVQEISPDQPHLHMYAGNRYDLRVEIVNSDKFLIPLQIWQNKKKRTKGWTREENSSITYVIWYFPKLEMSFLVYFPRLFNIFSDKWREWAFLKDGENFRFKRWNQGDSEHLLVSPEFLIEQVGLSSWNIMPTVKDVVNESLSGIAAG